MAQHGEAVLAVDGHRLDDVAVGERVEEVAQLAVDAGDDDPAAVDSSRSSPAVVCSATDRSLPATVTVICADTVRAPS